MILSPKCQQFTICILFHILHSLDLTCVSSIVRSEMLTSHENVCGVLTTKQTNKQTNKQVLTGQKDNQKRIEGSGKQFLYP